MIFSGLKKGFDAKTGDYYEISETRFCITRILPINAFTKEIYARSLHTGKLHLFTFTSSDETLYAVLKH